MKYQTCILSNEEGAIMGLFNKLKNVLFEEEEIEVPEIDIPEMEPVKEREKEPVKKKEQSNLSYRIEDEIMSDRELFKAEPTFNFPMFDEAEFESVKQEEVVETPKFEPISEPKTRVKNTPVVENTTSRTRSESRAEKTVYKEPRKTREVREKKEKSSRENRKFTPSPVISPVYGVLDKNYKKEDVVVPREEKKRIDVDSVRKKAFGTLEEDIEKTLNTPIREFYEEKEEYDEIPKKKKSSYKELFQEPEMSSDDMNFDHLLQDSVEDVIPVSYEEEPNTSYSSFNIEEPIESSEEEKSLEVLDRPKKKQEVDKKVEDTLENDLFDLIDSMYENREEGE